MSLPLMKDGRRPARGVLAAAQAISLIACGASMGVSTGKEAEGTPQPTGVAQSVPKVTESGTVLAATCGEQDGTCNARDEDCDGSIDEGCGYATGAIQITLGWDSGADLDLYVTDPSGQTIFFNREHRTSDVGGEMDQDARGDCRTEQTHQRVENAYWKAPAPPGEYHVEVHYFSPCGTGGATHATLSIAVSGALLGAYEYELAPEDRVSAARFTIPE